MKDANCFWCGARLFEGKCHSCEAYKLALKNAPSRIDGYVGGKKEPRANQYKRKLYPEARNSLDALMKGIKYD